MMAKVNVREIPVKTDFRAGGYPWTVIESGAGWVRCITAKPVSKSAFDERGRNDFSVSDLRDWLDTLFYKVLIDNGVPEEMFRYFEQQLVSEDGMTNYGTESVRVGLITCDEFRALRDNIPHVRECWWTATADSPMNTFVRVVAADGTLSYQHPAGLEQLPGVRPVCVFDTEVLMAYLDHGKEARKEAIDAVKRAIVRWEIDPEELYVFDDEDAGDS